MIAILTSTARAMRLPVKIDTTSAMGGGASTTICVMAR